MAREAKRRVAVSSVAATVRLAFRIRNADTPINPHSFARGCANPLTSAVRLARAASFERVE